MPGSGVGDRVHNFFGQENFSQGQHFPQIVDGNWPGLNNALPAGSQRQINASASFNPNLKIYNLRQSDSERAYGGLSFDIPHGLNLMKSAFRPELGRSHSQSQQPVLGGHMYGHQVFQTTQTEMNHLGADSESNRHNLISRGFSIHEAQQQLCGQHSGTLQSLSRQHSGVSDMQLLQQQAMFKQMQELQRQQFQRQQQENVNQFTAIANQAMGNCATLINGIPVHNASNSSWPPETVAADSNLLQRGSSPLMQGPSTGHMISSQHNQALQLMDMVPQQADSSFYGVPVSSTGNLGQYSNSQRACDNSFSGIQYAAPEQVSKRDAASRQEIKGKSMSGHATVLRNIENDLKNSQQLDSALMPDLHEKHELAQLTETSQERPEEKPAALADTSQDVATLDPTEEKILFGSEDSVWDVFGTSAVTGMGANNMLDGTDFALPSMSSGTWSALMQSAVAETSSGDVALQEQWCGPSFHNTEPQTRNLQTSANITSGKTQPFWPDGSLQNASSLNHMSSPFSGDAGTRTTYGSISGDFRHNQTGNLQVDHSQRSMQQFSVDGKNRLDRNSLREGLLQGDNVCANVSNSLGTESNVKSTSGSWTHQLSAPSYNNNNDDHQSNGQIGWNFIDSFSPAGVANSRGHRNESDGDIREKMGEAANYSNAGSHVERKRGGSNISGLQVNEEDTKVDLAAIANLQNTKANPENSQQLLHDRNLNFWKHVSPSVSSRGSTTPNNFQPNIVAHSHSFALAGNDGLDKGAAERHVDDANKNENSSDSFCSIASQHTSGGSGRREHVWLNAGDSHNLLGSREESSNQVGQRLPGVRKFHYHPMGDVELDVELSHGSKQNINTQSMNQQVSREFKGDQGHPGQPRFSSPIANISVEAKQGHAPAWGQPECIHVDPSKKMISAYARDAPANFDGSVGNFSNSAPSKNMSELFHEADQLKVHHPSRNVSSNFHSSSEMRGAGQDQRETNSLSQNFGLQLGLPSQRSIIKYQTSFSQSPELNSFNSSHMSSGAFLRAADQGNNSTASCSQSPYPINHLQQLALANSSGQSSTHQPANLSFNGSNMLLLQTDASSERGRNPDLASVANVSQSAQSNDLFPPAETCQPNNIDQSHMRGPCQEFPSLETMPIAQPSATAGMFQKGPSVDSSPKLQSNSPSQQQSLGGHASDFYNSHAQPKYDVQRSFSAEQNPDGQYAQGNRSCDTVAFDPQGIGESQSVTAEMQHQMSAGDGSAQNPLGTSQGRASIVNHLPDASPLSTSITQRDIEVFGRSLRPNNISDNLSLLHQMQSMRKAEADLSNRNVKRSRGPDAESVASRGGEKIINYTSTVKDASINHIPAFTRGEHPQISLQMAPSWFDQYGTFKNGQMLPVYGAKTSMGVKAVDHPIIAGGSSKNSLACSSLDKLDSVANASQPDSIQQVANPLLMAREQFSSPRSLPPQVNDGSLAVETKKRKSGTFEVLPWCKEVMQCSQGPQNSRMSEVGWAQATNRLTEKVEDDSDMIEDVKPIRRSKRRLVITTQLLQQLLRPPPASVISSDATAHSEDLVYYISRLALGDACSLISFKKNSYTSRGSRSLPSEKSKESERFDEGLSKVTENFIGRAKKLEDLLKLEKGVSVLDLRLEFQDLEKFSVINRFAMFHSRSQADGAEKLSSSDANANSQKLCPQRYVTAVPMPRNIPDRVQCLSL